MIDRRWRDLKLVINVFSAKETTPPPRKKRKVSKKQRLRLQRRIKAESAKGKVVLIKEEFNWKQLFIDRYTNSIFLTELGT